MLYFIQAGDGGPVKIGICGDRWRVHRRCTELQIGNPYPLRVTAVIEGGPVEEAELHARFASQRLVGEWFAPCDELTALAQATPGDADRHAVVVVDQAYANGFREGYRAGRAEAISEALVAVRNVEQRVPTTPASGALARLAT